MPNTGPDAVQHIALIAAFKRGGEVLLLRRPNDVHCGSLWSFPGGKLEGNETPLQTAARELKEETGLCGEHWRSCGKTSHPYSDRHLNLLLFACLCPDTSGLNCESAHTWAKRNALETLPMPEANAGLTPMLVLPEMDEYWDYGQV